MYDLCIPSCPFRLYLMPFFLFHWSSCIFVSPGGGSLAPPCCGRCTADREPPIGAKARPALGAGLGCGVGAEPTEPAARACRLAAAECALAQSIEQNSKPVFLLMMD